jgi:hypothetical protein
MAGDGVERAGRESFVVEQLCTEFGDRLDPVMIRAVAAEELNHFAGAKVREFVPIFAWRRARARLRSRLELATEAAGDLGRPA